MRRTSLQHRVDRLNERLRPSPPPAPRLVFSDEDHAIAARIMQRTYADPVRYAKRIELFERIAAKQEAQERPPAESRRRA